MSPLGESDPLVGVWAHETCPRCGAALLKNTVGDVWCSFVECAYARTPEGVEYSMFEARR